MSALRDAIAAINSRMQKHATSDAAASVAGGAVISIVFAFITEGRAWQFAFAFMGGIAASTAIFMILQPHIWGKIHEDVQRLKTEMDSLAARAEATGYLKAVRDVQDAIAKAGGDRP